MYCMLVGNKYLFLGSLCRWRTLATRSYTGLSYMYARAFVTQTGTKDDDGDADAALRSQ